MEEPVDEIDPAALLNEARSGNAQAVSRLLEHYRPYLAMLARLATSRRLQAKYDDSLARAAAAHSLAVDV